VFNFLHHAFDFIEVLLDLRFFLSVLGGSLLLFSFLLLPLDVYGLPAFVTANPVAIQEEQVGFEKGEVAFVARRSIVVLETAHALLGTEILVLLGLLRVAVLRLQFLALPARDAFLQRYFLGGLLHLHVFVAHCIQRFFELAFVLFFVIVSVQFRILLAVLQDNDFLPVLVGFGVD